jgi:hypothetical protein
MQLHSARTSPPHPSPKETIPYSTEALRQDLERLRGIWDDCQPAGTATRSMRTWPRCTAW